MLWPADARFSRSAASSAGRQRHRVRKVHWFRFARSRSIDRPGRGELARFGDFAPHIDDFDRCHRAIVHALQQAQQTVTPAPRIGVRLARGSRRAEHDRAIRESRERDREIARVIVNSFFAFVRRVVLLVDDDQTEVVQRRENHRARTNHHARLSANRGHPAGPSIGHALRAVRDADERAETRAKGAYDFVGERYFGHHDQHVAAGGQRARGEVQVNLGLAAGGDAPEQKRFITSMIDGRRDRIQRDLLFAGEVEVSRDAAVRCGGSRVDRDQPALREAL